MHTHTHNRDEILQILRIHNDNSLNFYFCSYFVFFISTKSLFFFSNIYEWIRHCWHSNEDNTNTHTAYRASEANGRKMKNPTNLTYIILFVFFSVELHFWLGAGKRESFANITNIPKQRPNIFRTVIHSKLPRISYSNDCINGVKCEWTSRRQFSKHSTIAAADERKLMSNSLAAAVENLIAPQFYAQRTTERSDAWTEKENI